MTQQARLFRDRILKVTSRQAPVVEDQICVYSEPVLRRRRVLWFGLGKREQGSHVVIHLVAKYQQALREQCRFRFPSQEEYIEEARSAPVDVWVVQTKCVTCDYYNINIHIHKCRRSSYINSELENI